MLMMYNDGHKCGDLSNKLDIHIEHRWTPLSREQNQKNFNKAQDINPTQARTTYL